MPLSLTKNDIAERLRDYSRQNYLLLANVIKGVVLGTATLTAIHIAADPLDNLQKIPAFICSGAVTFVTYVTWTRGVLLTNSRSNTRDAVLPLIMGGLEVALFAVLSTDRNPSQFPAPWHYWFFVLALNTWFAVRLVKNRINNAKDEDFDQELHQLAIYTDYHKWMKDDVKEANKGAAASLIFGLITWFSWLRAGQSVIGWTVPTYLGDLLFALLPIVPLTLILLSTRNASRQLRDLDEIISKAMKKAAQASKTKEPL